MNPVSAPVKRHPERRGLREAAPPQAVRGFDNRKFRLGRRQPARRRNAGGSRPDDHDIEITRLAGRNCWRSGGRR